MKRSEIVALFRSRIDDAEQPYLWKDPEVWRYLDDAHAQAAIRARLIRDSSSPAVCVLSFLSPVDAITAANIEALALQVVTVAAETAIALDGDAGMITAFALVVTAVEDVVEASEAAVIAQGTGASVRQLRTAGVALNEALVAARLVASSLAHAPVTAAMATVRTVALDAAITASELAAAGDVSMSKLVREVIRARVDGAQPLDIPSVDAMDAERPGWESRTGAGTPRSLVLERTSGGLRARLYPLPATSGTLRLTVTRLPSSNLNTDDDEPEIQAEHHEALVHWMMRCAYLKRDSETYDKAQSDDCEARFAAHFGLLPDANVLRKQADRRPSVVQFLGMG